MRSTRTEPLRQLGVRVPDATNVVFTVAAAGYGISVQELLSPVLEAEAARLQQIPEVGRMVREARKLRSTSRK